MGNYEIRKLLCYRETLNGVETAYRVGKKSSPVTWIFIFTYVCGLMCVYDCMCLYVCDWRPQVNIKAFPLFLSTLVFETVSQ